MEGSEASAGYTLCPFILSKALMQEQLQKWALVWSSRLIGRKLFMAEVTRGSLENRWSQGNPLCCSLEMETLPVATPFRD